ncbi:Unknown protein [Striga hermonthica]|uniref:Uncharacterized protein n=1 Tax=Striga hermonthica TaxID=68872 RepID=A0A9N7MUD0_STRHE|nr:Unknown protein [Striga hermonthica]
MQDDETHQFLLGLDTDLYGLARLSRLAQYPLSSFDRVYSVISQEERLASSSNSSPDFLSFATSTPLRPPSSKSTSTSRGCQCSVCEKSSHNIAVCFCVKPCPHCQRTDRDDAMSWSDIRRAGGLGTGRENFASAPAKANSTSANNSLQLSDFGSGHIPASTCLSLDQWQTLVNFAQ